MHRIALAVIALLAWLAPCAPALAQTLPYAPSRVPMVQVMRAASTCGVHLQPQAVLDAYEAYTLRYLDTFRELDAAHAAAVAASSAMRGVVPDAKEERTASQMRRRSLEHATRLTDELLDALAPAVPAAEAEYIPAFRDELHAVTLWGSAPTLIAEWAQVNMPTNLSPFLSDQVAFGKLDDAALASLQAVMRSTAAERRTVAAKLWRSADDARVRAATTAEQVGLSGKPEKQSPSGSYDPEWAELAQQVQQVTMLDDETVRAHLKLQWQLWLGAREALPQAVRRQVMGEMQGAIPTMVPLSSSLMIPVMLDMSYSPDGTHIVRTALALPGLTPEQRRQIREEGLRWLDARAQLLEDMLGKFSSGATDLDHKPLVDLDVAARSRLAEITEAPWLRLRLDASGRPRHTRMDPAEVPSQGSLALAPEDDAAVPLGLRGAGNARSSVTPDMIGRAQRKSEGKPPAPSTDCKARAEKDLALSEGEAAVFGSLLEDMVARWRAEVEPRVQRYGDEVSAFHGNRAFPQDGTEAEQAAYFESYRTEARRIGALREDAWRNAHDAWKALASSASAALPAEKRDLATLWIENERAEMCVPQINSRIRIPTITSLMSTPYLDAASRGRAVVVLAERAPTLVDQVDEFRALYARSRPDSIELFALQVGLSDQESQADVAKAHAATRAALDRVIAGCDETVASMCEQLSPEACADVRRARQALQAVGGLMSLRPLLDELPAGPARDAAQAAVLREQPRLNQLADEYFECVLRERTDLEGSWDPRTMTSPNFARGSILYSAANDLYVISLWRIRNLLPPEVAQSCKSFERLRALDGMLPSARPAPAAQ